MKRMLVLMVLGIIEQGHIGEQKEALDMAIKALEQLLEA